MLNELIQLRDMCKDYTVLYAEDDEQTQESMGSILQKLFKTTYIANNGAEAITLFKNHHPDIVLTDIQMPKITGLELARVVKDISSQTPIIITTAFNEERYFLSAIELGIDSFLLKPIDKDKLFNVLYKTITQIAYQKKAQELEELKKIEAINQASEESIQSFSNLLPFPALFYKENHLIFVNLQAQKTFESLCLEHFSLETSFVSRFHITKDRKQKIKIPTKNGLNRIYWVYSNALFIGVDFTLVQAYVFVDITIMEYQKIRLSAHTFPELQKRYTYNDIEHSSALPQEALCAKTFYETLDENVLLELKELQELQEFLVHFSYDYHANPNDALRAKLTDLYLCYARSMETLKVFEHVSQTIQHTTQKLLHAHLSQDHAQKISLFLISLSEELFQWYTTLFISRNAPDIHYLDESIMASCLHIEAELQQTHHTTLGEDLELS